MSETFLKSRLSVKKYRTALFQYFFTNVIYGIMYSVILHMMYLINNRRST